jgi:hypothetical protein
VHLDELPRVNQGPHLVALRRHARERLTIVVVLVLVLLDHDTQRAVRPEVHHSAREHCRGAATRAAQLGCACSAVIFSMY